MTITAYSSAQAIAIVLILAYLIKKFVLTPNTLPLPPGPRGIPIFGNIADLPPKGTLEWKHWLKFKDVYGGMCTIQVMGQTIILMHDLEATLELLDKRGAKYSSRGRQVFAGEMCGYNERMPFRSNNHIFRRQRKLAGGQLGTRSAITRYHSAMDLEVRRFLLRTLNKPEGVIGHLETESGSLMLSMLYGYTPSPHTPDALVRLINTVMEEFSKAVVVGAWMVDILPFLRFLPDWVPGTCFKKTARQWKKDSDNSMNVPVDFVTQQIAQNSAKPSYVERLLRANPNDAEVKMDTEQSAAALYAGGADSTAAGLSFFFLAMTAFPDVQAKAREEIDRVVGPDRLPGFQDRDKLPYIEAVIKETLRWHPLAPIGPPHLADEEDEFRGYRIPKGAMILPSIKWFSSDPAVYPDPEAFKPERFLGPNPQPDPAKYIFGFGRRICPGRLLADSNIFLTIAQTLAVFDIRKAVDKETGRVVEPMVGTTAGLVAHPLLFECRIVPRSERCVEVIREVEREHPWEVGDARFLRGLEV
ncbi:cytochrome P450 oxidoreductase OrdA-like protein [Byssothecium circinans]|uniref:Cytochrome P450 oxidoreductase OrdA-like protein n=1 Tax=Byssothecium circinans TaxID=147558 RepID=A0A6A5TLJ8_9PLEO|nr:cytochrome P450 oxidoreductase OrdA-like protein [Byssothecium circinans]